MADIFGSSKQPSLFPMTISFPVITKEDYLLFYKNERDLFTVLLVVLHREVIQSIFMMGFLLWLEREGYTSKNLSKTMVNYLSADVIDQVADDIMICLKFMEKKANGLMFEGSSKQFDTQILHCFLDRKSINLEELYRSFDEVSAMAKEVSGKAFDDILEYFIRCGGPFVLHSTQEVTVCNVVGGFRYVGPIVPFPSYDFSKYVAFCTTPASVSEKEQEDEVAPENRTIFLTFSKGYPISESEVKVFFTRIFGDFIEAIYMQPVVPENQPLFARIVARSPAMVRAVVERDGADGKSKYYINGKHVWARKYVKRTPSNKDTIDGAGTSD